MPPIIQGHAPLGTSWNIADNKMLGKDFRYKYPDGLNLNPNDSELHRIISAEIYNRATESHHHMSRRYDSWMRTDDTLVARKDLTKEETNIQKKDKNRPVSLVVPISFAIRETILTHFVNMFLSPPTFRYKGVGEKKNHINAAKLQALVDLQFQQSGMGLELYSCWQDSIDYGLGIGMPLWEKQFSLGSARDPLGDQQVMFEGNRLGHLSPYDFLPDPNAHVNQIQRAEYVGFVEHTSLSELLNREESEPEKWFNVRYLWGANRRSVFQAEHREFQNRPMTDHFGAIPVDVIHMSVVLIPKLWGLGTSTRLEKWIFSLAGDGIIIRAEPLGLFYNEHQFACCAPLFDNYSIVPTSLLERIQGLQLFADWLINAHMVNVRKALGINIVYDPKAINGADLRSKDAVKLIRMMPTHWGRGDVNKYIHQLTINDVTQQNVPDTAFLFDVIQRVSGVGDIPQGIMKGGERRSAREAGDVFSSSMSRIQKSAKMISMQFHMPIARQFAWNIEQLMSKEEVVEVTGDMHMELVREYGAESEEAGLKTLDVTPDDFADFKYNIVPHDASIPGEEDREGWTQLVQPFLSQPQAFQALGLDGQRIFLHIARQLGARDAADFVLRPPQVRTVPDEEFERGTERGDFAPLEAVTASGF